MGRMKVAVTVLVVLSGLVSELSAQGDSGWIVRLGGSGTGTFDEGTIAFSPSTGLGAESFRFSNSWGIAASVERVWKRRWHFGVHGSYAATDFRLTTPSSGGGTFRSEDRTTFAPLLLDVKYGVLPGHRINPLVGLTGGVLLARDAQLALEGGSRTDFRFADRGTYGYVLGADVALGGGWLIHFAVRSLGFEYSLEDNALIPAQTLLDQDFQSAFNHLVFAVGRRW